MFFETYYCLFMFTCFYTELGTVPFIKDSKGNDVACPKGCSCYMAPTGKFSTDTKNFSLICNDIPTDLDLPVPIYLNTIVYKNVSGSSHENLISTSIVMSNVNDEYSLSNKQLKYVTVVQQKNVQILYNNAEGIHIENSTFRDNSYKYEDTKSYPMLRSLTIRSSMLETIDSDHFFPNAPLITIDLSDNLLVNVEPICTDSHPSVVNLYLNSNRLSELPENLAEQFPKLRILHIRDNRFKVITNSRFEKFINIHEFIVFDVDVKDENGKPPYIYNYNLNSDLLSSIENGESIQAIGFLDSFVKGLEYICSNGTSVKWPEILKQENCEFDGYPHKFQKVAGTGSNLSQPLYYQSVNVSGLSAQISNVFRLYKDAVDSGDNFNTMVINIRYQWAYMVARNMLMKVEPDQHYLILDLHEDIEAISLDVDDTDLASDLRGNNAFNSQQYIEWLLKLIHNRENIIGFEVIYIEWELFKDVHPKYSDICPLISHDAKQLFDNKIKKYDWFYKNLIKHENSSNLVLTRAGKYIGPFLTLKVDIRSIDLLRLFMSNKQMENCFGVSPLITAFNIINVEPESNSFDQQIKTLREIVSQQQKMRNENDFVPKNIFFQVNLNQTYKRIDPFHLGKLYQISPNVIRHFID